MTFRGSSKFWFSRLLGS